MKNEQAITVSKQEFEQLKAENAWLKFRLADLERLVYGVKSERHIQQNPNQPTLFELPKEENEKTAEFETITRKKPENNKHPLRMEIPAHLPRVTEVIEPENLPDDAKKIGELVTEVLEYNPASIYVRQIIRPKYIVKQDDEQTIIVTANLPSLPIFKGNAGASMLAYITISKFVDHLPFYRQAQMFKRQKLDIPESTIGGWFASTCKLIVPLYETLKDRIFLANYLQADETPIPVLTQDKPGATHKGYHWVYHDPLSKIVLFDYHKSRGREGPDELLKNFSGHLQTDGYSAYNNLTNKEKITQLACMAHARRKFEHAKDSSPLLAIQALNLFGKLYDIERKASKDELTCDQIKELRQNEAKPILDEIKTWLDKHLLTTLPKSAIGMAIAYTHNLWPRLIRYIEDGRFQIDNNLIENTIRPVALGRKNYLFAGSHDAAQNAAMIYSLLATCKINKVEPLEWLTKVLSILPNCPADRMEDLLPCR